MSKFLKLAIFLFITFFSSIASSNSYYKSWGNISNGTITSTGSTPIGIKSVAAYRNLLPNSHNRKITFSANIKATNVKGGSWTGLWIRADEYSHSGDGKGKGKYYRIYSPIKGTTNWAKKSVSLEVPSYAKFISYGITLQGSGKIEISNGHFSWD